MARGVATADCTAARQPASCQNVRHIEQLHHRLSWKETLLVSY